MASAIEIAILARNETRGALEEVRRGLAGVGDSADYAGGGAGRLAAMLKVPLVTGAAAAASALAAVAGVAASVAQEFDDAQDTLIAATGASGEALDAMSDSVRELHGDVGAIGRTFSDVAAVMGEVNTRTGATGEALDDFTEDVLRMTRITGDDGVGAVRLITRTMGDWGVSMDDSAALMDKLFGAGQAYGIGLDALTSKLVQFGAPMRLMGFTLDESIALFGKWEKEGVNAEVIMASLRQAAGNFAEAQNESNGAVLGGVESLAESQAQLDKLRAKLSIATAQQNEFTDKTKESSRLAKSLQISELTQQIGDLEAAMALGEFRTESSTAAQKTFGEQLRDSFEAIKNATTETEAYNIATGTFGAKAAADMTAAVREGRFELEEAIAMIGGMAGSIDDVTERSTGIEERWAMAMTRVRDSLIPVGQELMELGITAMPFVERAAEGLANFLGETLPGAISGVKDAWESDWMGIRTNTEEAGEGLRIEWVKIRLQAALLAKDIKETFDEAEIKIDWSGIHIPISDKTEFVLEWSELAGVARRGMINIGSQITFGFGWVRGLWRYSISLITGDWEGAWEGWKLSAQSGLDAVLSMIEVWSPELSESVRKAMDAAKLILEVEFVIMGALFDQFVAQPIKDFWNWLKGADSGGDSAGTFGRRFDPAMDPDPTGYVPGYAAGTAFAAGGLAVVGEQGPELVRLPRGAQVLSNSQSRNMIRQQAQGGASIVLNVYATLSNDVDVAVLTERIMQELRKRQGMQAWQPTF